jgi:proteic killer suppression protein
MSTYEVDLSKVAHLVKKKLPSVIVDKIYLRALRIKLIGLVETRKIKGLHDEPLKRNRKGERSVRLNDQYRLIYIEICNENVILVKVIEVNKHDY